MPRLLALLAAAAIAGCTGADATDPCQQACDITDAGKLATRCDPFAADGHDTSPPNDYGGCFCTVDGVCPGGYQPHR
jgi:hypothetical protein